MCSLVYGPCPIAERQTTWAHIRMRSRQQYDTPYRRQPGAACGQEIVLRGELCCCHLAMREVPVNGEACRWAGRLQHGQLVRARRRGHGRNQGVGLPDLPDELCHGGLLLDLLLQGLQQHALAEQQLVGPPVKLLVVRPACIGCRCQPSWPPSHLRACSRCVDHALAPLSAFPPCCQVTGTVPARSWC